jgi:hypothetical protein
MFFKTALERSCRCEAVRRGRGGALVGGEGDDEDEEDAEGTTSVPAPAEGGGGSGPGARRSGLRPVPAGGSFSVEKAWRVEREREREREKERRGRVFFVLAGAVGRKNELDSVSFQYLLPLSTSVRPVCPKRTSRCS